jgi:foldase protein PrsA
MLLSILAVVIIGLLVGFLTTLGKQQKPELGDHALKVGGQWVSAQIFREERTRFYLRYRTNALMLRKTDEERMDLILEEIVNRVVVEDYLHHQAQVTVAPQEVDNYIERYIKTRFDTPEKMEAYMADSFYRDEADLKKGIELYLYKLKGFAKLAGKLGLTIPAAELDELYQRHVADNYEVVARHILISDPDPGKTERRAGDIFNQLKNGVDFEKLAAEYSADIRTRLAGGLMEPFTKETTVPEVAQKVFAAKAGDLIPPVRTRMGHEIIRVEKFIDLSHPKAEFADMVLVEKFGESDQYKNWLKQVKSKKPVEIMEPAMKAYRLYSTGKYKQAGQVYEKAFAVYDNQNFRDRAVDSYRLAKNWPKVIRLSQSCIDKFPDRVPYYLYKAEGLYYNGQTKDALQLMRKAEDLSVNNLYYSNLVIQMYATLGLETEAARFKEKIGQ